MCYTSLGQLVTAIFRILANVLFMDWRMEAMQGLPEERIEDFVLV
jgi:hypothetical protein